MLKFLVTKLLCQFEIEDRKQQLKLKVFNRFFVVSRISCCFTNKIETINCFYNAIFDY